MFMKDLPENPYSKVQDYDEYMRVRGHEAGYWRANIEFAKWIMDCIEGNNLCDHDNGGLFVNIESEKWIPIRNQLRELLAIPEKIEMKPIPKDSYVITLDEFIEAVNNNYFIDYDGSGKYATATEMSNQVIIPSFVKIGHINRNFTHVVWFNK